MNINDPYKKLTEDQSNLLKNAGQSQFPHQLDGYSSIDDILDKLNVTVEIERGIEEHPIPLELIEAEHSWEVISKKKQERKLEGEEEIEYENSRKKHQEFENWKTMKYRGYYYYDHAKKSKKIVLFPDEMKEEYDGRCMNELLVSTLAHETMHAYFDRPGHEKVEYKLFIEEPLAEFGMLLYIHEANMPAVNQYYKWAYNDVQSKQTCYHYGANLMDQFLNENNPYSSDIYQYLKEYKFNVSSLESPHISNGKITLPSRIPEVDVDGKKIPADWRKVFRYEPIYFWEEHTHTLGLDGDWSGGDLSWMYYSNDTAVKPIFTDVNIMGVSHKRKIDNVYLGDKFSFSPICSEIVELLSSAFVTVSPYSQMLNSTDDGVAINKIDKKPILPYLRPGLYARCKNETWFAVDDSLKEVDHSTFSNLKELKEAYQNK